MQSKDRASMIAFARGGSKVCPHSVAEGRFGSRCYAMRADPYDSQLISILQTPLSLVKKEIDAGIGHVPIDDILEALQAGFSDETPYDLVGCIEQLLTIIRIGSSTKGLKLLSDRKNEFGLARESDTSLVEKVVILFATDRTDLDVA